jgi:competence protein ComEC
MFGGLKKYWLIVFIVVLLGGTLYLFYLDFQNRNRGLTFAMFNIGQGDGLFVESPTGTQVLIDAGPPRKILSQLTHVMSPFDRKIDAVIITNPDEDHIGGFMDVFKNYKVSEVFEPGTFNDSKIYKNVENEISKRNISKILAKKGMRLDLGGGAFIDFLFPNQDVSNWDTNDGSIVAKLTYGDMSILLAGDSTAKTEKIILEDTPPELLASTILKVGHHGSRTSTSLDFTSVVAPAYALISNGEDNKYGHPHQETLNTLTELGVKVFQTDLLGTIIMKSDGQNVQFSFKK